MYSVYLQQQVLFYFKGNTLSNDIKALNNKFLWKVYVKHGNKGFFYCIFCN